MPPTVSTCCLLLALAAALPAAPPRAAVPAEPVPAELAPQLEQPVLDAVQRGATHRLVLTGRGLARVSRVVFDGAAADLLPVVVERAAGRIAVDLAVARTAATGTRFLRVVTPAGVSNPVRLQVTPLPVHEETEPNDLPAADPIPVPALVCGAIHAAGQRDGFRFRGSPGQPVAFDLSARRLGSALDPALTVLDPRGRTVAWGRPATGGDAALVFDPPAAGDYVLVVRDVRFRGGPGFRYHLRVAPRPVVEAVFPLAGRQGRRAVVALNPGADCGPREPATMELDLSAYRPGDEHLEVTAGDGSLVRAGFAVTGFDAIVETEPNDRRASAQTLSVPIAVSGRIDRAGDTDTYRLTVAAPVTLRLDLRAGAFGSPLDPLLELQDAGGNRLKIDDDSGEGRDSRIEHPFAKGEYLVRVRSLVARGGADHTYLLTVAPPTPPVPSCEVRLRPDTPVVRRGGRTRLWCEVVRRGGFTGPVDLGFADLPPGVHIDPVRLQRDNGWTSVFTVWATADAVERAVTLRPRATAVIGGRKLEVQVHPESGPASSGAAWLAVAGAAPFAVAPLGPPPERVRAEWAKERAALEQRLQVPDAELAPALAEFGARLAAGGHWLALEPTALVSGPGSASENLADGSIRVSGTTPSRDTYKFEATIDPSGRAGLDAVRALRLDVLPDPATPTGGIGRSPGHGNFVLSRLEVVGEGSGAAKLVRPTASYSQEGYPVAHAIDGKSGTGWAVAGRTDQPQWAIFELESPLPLAAGPTKLTVLMDQQHGGSHLIGRFRLSVADRRRDSSTQVVPATVARIARAQQRSPAEQQRLVRWFREQDSGFAGIRRRIAEIDAGRGHQREIERLEQELRAADGSLAAAQRRWEEQARREVPKWTDLAFSELRSDHGARFTRQPDEVVRVRRAVADRDGYTLLATTAVRGITAIRIEVLPERDLPQGGVGLAGSGNFVLSRLRLEAGPSAAALAPVELHGPQASFAQQGFPIEGTLDSDPATGWAVYPAVDRPHHAVWRTRTRIGTDGPVVLRLRFEHDSQHPRHQIGRFRVSVTDGTPPARSPENPQGGDLSPLLARALHTEAQRRTAAQRRALQAHFQRIDPASRGLQERIARLRNEQMVYPPVLARSGAGTLAVRLTRQPGFTGPVELSLEGFSAGRERDRQPRPFTASFSSKPVTVPAGSDTAVLSFTALPKCAPGTRAVVVRAQAEVGSEVVVEYGPPVPFTVRDK